MRDRIRLTNSFQPDSTGVAAQRISHRRPGDTEIWERSLDYHEVNIERHPLPFDDGSFEVALFCEVIEHLLTDPVAALSELGRVLRPGGLLVVTTPNAARLENVARLVAGVTCTTRTRVTVPTGATTGSTPGTSCTGC